MLNMAKVKLELIPDPGIYIFFEKGQRAGVSHISNRYSKAKNKYLKSYDPKQESKHIIYTQTQITYMALRYQNFFKQAASNGQIQKSLTQINILALVQEEVFLNLILNIQKN